MRLAYHTLDVFTQTRFGGNPLAVVLEADALTSAQMQSVAREFNLSETVFVLKAQSPAHSARIRIFTPVTELPFAGHPTIGTAALLAQLRGSAAGGDYDALMALEESIGPVRVGVRMRPGSTVFAEFDAPRLPEDQGAVPVGDDLAAALGLIPSEIGFENHRPTGFSAGLAFTFVPVSSLQAIGRARAVIGRWDATFGRQGFAYLYCRDTVHNAANFHARMFSPGHGVIEDPATGSAAAAFAGIVHRFDTLPSGEHRFLIEQGYEMGRPSQLHLAIAIEGQKIGSVRIGGYSIRVADGVIEV